MAGRLAAALGQTPTQLHVIPTTMALQALELDLGSVLQLEAKHQHQSPAHSTVRPKIHTQSSHAETLPPPTHS
jgi:hypothetical protein